MITSQQMSFLCELRQTPIPGPTLVELEARMQHRIHSMILDAFNKSGLSQKDLADRLGWDTARVSRLLGVASNLTLSTISAVLAAVGVDLDDPSYTSFDQIERRLRAPMMSTKPSRPNGRLSNMSIAVQMDLFLRDATSHPVGQLRTLLPASMPIGTVQGLDVVPQHPRDGKVIDLAKYRTHRLGEGLIGGRYA